MGSVHCVTGAFGYSGRRIARGLLARGFEVITLTSKSDASGEFAGRVKSFSFAFDRPDELARTLAGVDVLHNTYWVRYNHRRFTHAEAVRNTQILFAAAKRAGVRRIIHTSITNPSEDSPLEYFRGKAVLERSLRETGLSHAIIRPAVLFGGEDILVNNIAWTLRRLPVFGVFGDGSYRLQPIHVDDFAALFVDQAECTGNAVVEAIGPETFTYRQLAATIAGIIGVRRRVISVPPAIGYWVGRLIGWLQRDVTITREEIKGLMDDLLFVDAPPAGSIRLTDWARENRDTLGRRYHSELARRH